MSKTTPFAHHSQIQHNPYCISLPDIDQHTFSIANTQRSRYATGKTNKLQFLTFLSERESSAIHRDKPASRQKASTLRSIPGAPSRDRPFALGLGASGCTHKNERILATPTTFGTLQNRDMHRLPDEVMAGVPKTINPYQKPIYTLVRNTRYSANTEWARITIPDLKADPKSSFYVTSEQRFDRARRNPVVHISRKRGVQDKNMSHEWNELIV